MENQELQTTEKQKKISKKDIYLYIILIIATIVCMVTTYLDMWIVNKYTMLIWQACFLLLVVEELIRCVVE